MDLKNLREFKEDLIKFLHIEKLAFYDDYAHHPTEIKEVLNGVRAAYKKEEVICVFQPHRISRLKDLKKEFSLSFKKADTVILCPVYAAGEKIKLGFDYNIFAKDIIKNSKVKLFMVNNQYELAKLIKNTIYGKKIVVGMGAGTISAWMRELSKFNIMLSEELIKFSNEITSKIYFDYDLKKSNWFNIGGKTKIYFKPDNLPDLILFLKRFGNKEKIYILGAGSNTLITDNTFDGAVIKLGKNFSNISILPNGCNSCR